MEQKSGSASHELLIVERAETVAVRILESLQRKGFSVRTTSETKNLAQRLHDMVEPILVVECGTKTGCADYLSQFINTPQLHDYPILVLGRDVEGLEEQLRACFGLAATLRTPCPFPDILEAVRYIAQTYKREVATKAKVKETQLVGLSSARDYQFGQQDESEDLPDEKAHELYRSVGTIPGFFFEQLRKFNLANRSLGGERYPKMMKESALNTAELLPSDPRIQALIVPMLGEIGKWAPLHLHRAGYLMRALVMPLELDPVLKVVGIQALYLFPRAFARANASMLRKEYFGRGTVVVRKELCNFIRESAQQLTTTLKLPEIGDLVSLLGRLIGREEVVSDEPKSVVASAIMAADLADRVCYQDGYWNPRAAYSLVKRVKAGRLRDFHPAILCCLIKLLSEAITASPPAMVLNRKIRDNPALQEKAKANREVIVNDNEIKVSLASLSPGMKLSRPLFAFDGKQVLADDLILDQDLIWRIWQLTALRPLNSPVIIHNANAKKDTEKEEGLVSQDAAVGLPPVREGE